MVANTNESHWFHPAACEHRWPGNIHGHKQLSKLRVHKGGLGGMFFSPFYQGLVQNLLNWTKRFLKAFLSWAPQRFMLWVSLHGQVVRACPGVHRLRPGCTPSLVAHGDTHLANCLCSYCRRGGKEYLTKAKELGKEKKIWLSEFGTLQDHSELGVVTPPDTVSWPLAWFSFSLYGVCGFTAANPPLP